MKNTTYTKWACLFLSLLLINCSGRWIGYNYENRELNNQTRITTRDVIDSSAETIVSIFIDGTNANQKTRLTFDEVFDIFERIPIEKAAEVIHVLKADRLLKIEVIAKFIHVLGQKTYIKNPKRFSNILRGLNNALRLDAADSAVLWLGLLSPLDRKQILSELEEESIHREFCTQINVAFITMEHKQ